jgi:hypothetical protein
VHGLLNQQRQDRGAYIAWAASAAVASPTSTAADNAWAETVPKSGAEPETGIGAGPQAKIRFGPAPWTVAGAVVVNRSWMALVWRSWPVARVLLRPGDFFPGDFFPGGVFLRAGALFVRGSRMVAEAVFGAGGKSGTPMVAWVVLETFTGAKA